MTTPEQWSIILVPALIAIISGIVGVVYGNKKGLPDVRRELQEAKDDLIKMLQAQLEVAEDRAEAAERMMKECKPKLAAAERKIRELEREVGNLYRRLDATDQGRRSQPRRP